MRDPVLWRCNFCNGLANWCFIDDVLHYHCHRECGGFMQKDLFDDVDSLCYYGKDGSVSALTGGQAEYEKLVDRSDPRPEDPVPF